MVFIHIPATADILSSLSDTGQGVAEDKAEAAKWYRKAAERGHAQAQSNLGRSYDNGEGAAKDEVEAVKWDRRAAEQNHADAQYVCKASIQQGDRGGGRGFAG